MLWGSECAVSPGFPSLSDTTLEMSLHSETGTADLEGVLAPPAPSPASRGGACVFLQETVLGV